MGKGRIYEDRLFRYEDPYSGREIVRLTDYSNMVLVEVGDFDDLPQLTPDTPARPDMLNC